MKQIHEEILKMARRAILWVGLVLAVPVSAQSRPQPPDILSFQGTLLGADGTPIGASGTANYPMVFRVFTQATGGKLLWSEQQTLPVRDGVFSAMLGEGSVYANEPRPALSSLFQASNASERYIEVTVQGTASGEADATVEPRTRLIPGAYSLLASRARTAEDLVDADGRSLLTPSGDRVGINKANPQGTLDVAGSMAARGWQVRQTLTVAGIAEGIGFNGLGMAPVGSILMWTGTTPPKGWVLCDGSVVAGVTTPDLRGRFILGASTGLGLTPRPMNQKGGEEAHALSAGEIPGHAHQVVFSGVTTEEAFSGIHTYRNATVGMQIAPYYPRGIYKAGAIRAHMASNNTVAAGDHAHNFNYTPFISSTQGEGRPHNTMPPFYVLAFIIRVQ